MTRIVLFLVALWAHQIEQVAGEIARAAARKLETTR